MIPLREVIDICKNEEYENNLSNDQTEFVLRATTRYNLSNREELDKVVEVAKGKNVELSIDEIEDLLKEIGTMVEENQVETEGKEQGDSGYGRE